MRESRLGLKAATVTPEGKDDVGSPNRILREAARRPGDHPDRPADPRRDAGGGRALPDRRGSDGRRRRLRRRTGPRGARRRRVRLAHRADLAQRLPGGGRVQLPHGRRASAARSTAARSGPSAPCTRGMLKEEMDAAAERHPDVPYSPVLIDATYAGLITGAADAPLVIPALNRDGDCLSDFVLPMFGSIAGAESVLLALDERLRAAGRHGRGAARHGARAAGQGHRQPDGDDPGGRGAAALRGGAGPRGGGERPRARSTRRVLEAVAAGVRTPDLGGHASTTGFTDEVIGRVRTKIDVWSSLWLTSALTAALRVWDRRARCGPGEGPRPVAPDRAGASRAAPRSSAAAGKG